MEREASCHCGQLRMVCRGEPAKVSLCQCHECQRRTGSLFSVAAFFPAGAVDRPEAGARSYRRGSASGQDVTFHFCTRCGTTLWWEAQRLPAVIGVAVGGFADADFPMPEQAVWCEEGHGWLDLPPAMARHARNPVRPASGPRD